MNTNELETVAAPFVTQKLTIADMCHVSFATKGTVTHSACHVDGTDDGD